MIVKSLTRMGTRGIGDHWPRQLAFRLETPGNLNSGVRSPPIMPVGVSADDGRDGGHRGNRRRYRCTHGYYN